jgi:hypothetical protein
MKIKYNRLAVFVETKSKDFYQISLNKDQMDTIARLISQLHKGTIKIMPNKFDTMSFIKPLKK